MNHSRCKLNIGVWLLVCILPVAETASADSLKIATLNCNFLLRKKIHLKFGLPFDINEFTEEQRELWDRPGYRDARFIESVKVAAAVIKRIDADVIGLVEVGNERDVADLHRELRHLGLDYPHIAVCKSTDTHTGQHVALFSRRQLSEVQPQISGRAFYDAELDDPETENETGVSKGMSAKIDFAGRTVRLYLAHLSSERGGHEKDAQRIAQASIIRRHVVRDLENGVSVIVFGDINDGRGQPALRRLRGRDDIWEDLIQTGGPTFHYRRSNESNEAYNRRVGDHWTYEFAGRKQQLDHILISRSIYETCGRRGLQLQFDDVPESIPTTGTPLTDHRSVSLSLSADDAEPSESGR